MDGWMYGWMNGWMDALMDRWIAAERGAQRCNATLPPVRDGDAGLCVGKVEVGVLVERRGARDLLWKQKAGFRTETNRTAGAASGEGLKCQRPK